MTTGLGSEEVWRELCLVFVMREPNGEQQVLLGTKRRGFGAGRVVGPGGKVDDGESPREAAARELAEETSLVVDSDALRHAGLVTFVLPQPNGDALRLRTAVFTVVAEKVTGTPRPSDEIAAQWTDRAALPYDAMWPDAQHWLPHALDGTLDRAHFVYADDGATLVDASVTLR